MRSPGRPDPSRVVQRQFWRLIATGVTTAEASLAVGVSWPVGARWFRHAGGMPPISLIKAAGGVKKIVATLAGVNTKQGALSALGSGGASIFGIQAIKKACYDDLK